MVENILNRGQMKNNKKKLSQQYCWLFYYLLFKLTYAMF